jgi:hypothetical protein
MILVLYRVFQKDMNAARHLQFPLHCLVLVKQELYGMVSGELELEEQNTILN